MARGLDHIVHAVRDLDAAVELYRRLGFQVGARNLHPPTWGTQNHIIQLPGTFIELLAVADLSQLAPHTPQNFSFGAFNRDFLARGQGLSMLVLEGRGAPDADEFRAKGISDYELYEFEREGKRPDGTPLKVSFALSFASDPHAPETGFFTCLHRNPEKFLESRIPGPCQYGSRRCGCCARRTGPQSPCKVLERLRRGGRRSLEPERHRNQDTAGRHRRGNAGRLRAALWGGGA